jgi:general secretion pathway protein G
MISVIRSDTPARIESARRRISIDGFSLIEMLVVLALIGLLTALIGPQVVGYLGDAKEDAAKAEISNLETSLDLFKLDVGRYPTDREGLAALVERPPGVTQWHGPYLRHNQLPDDPWGRPYVFRVPGQHERYDLYSRGPDGDHTGPIETSAAETGHAGTADRNRTAGTQ